MKDYHAETYSEFIKIQASKNIPKMTDSLEYSLEKFAEFENKVKSDYKLLNAFRTLQHKLASDPVFRKTVEPGFADGIMLLNLSDGEIS